MARYKERCDDQSLMVPIRFVDQLQPGTFEYTVSHLVDKEIDLSGFAARYNNDLSGAPAYDPRILLKVVLFAYSRGIIGSRRIARACEENVVFMALSGDSRPHFTTIAHFITTMDDLIGAVFTEVLSICYVEGLIGGKMFAVDGCKISSNCSKEWSGTKAQLRKKAAKIQESIDRLLHRHRAEDEQDRGGGQSGRRDSERKAIENLRAKAKRVQEFLAENEDRRGAGGKPVKSNITDNESAKMPSAHGVIQGYNGIATVDAAHQIVLDAQAYGEGHEAKRLGAVIDSLRQTLTTVQGARQIFDDVVLTADSGFHSQQSVKEVFDAGVDAYIADNKFRLRDPRFSTLQQHRRKPDRKRTSIARKYFVADDFTFDESGALICPAGKPMWSRCPNWRHKNKGYTGRTYQGHLKNCSRCPLRPKCIRNPKTPARQVTKIDRDGPQENKSAVQRMIERFDSPRGRFYYSRRMGTVEPVFANIRHTLGLNRFTLRGRVKVDTQWKLFCLVHNIGKLARYGSIA
jgi:transposase